MKKRTLAITIAIAAIMLLTQVDRAGERTVKHVRPLPVSLEKKAKIYSVEQDVQLTAKLTAEQSKLGLRGLFENLAPLNTANKKAALHEFKASYPSVDRLDWYSLDHTATELSTGTERKQIPMAVLHEMDNAREALHVGREYETAVFITDRGNFMVMAVISPNQEQGLIGLIDQTILSKVEAESRRNMRLIVYPNPAKKPGMKTAEASNLQESKVNQPEENQGKSHYYNHEVIVKFKTLPSDQQMRKIRSDIQAKSVQRLGYSYVFEAQEMETKQLMKYFKKLNVEYSEPHFIYITNEQPVMANNSIRTRAEAVEAPNDTLYSNYQWNLPLIRAESGWLLSKGSSDVIVAVIDTGVDLTHPDLQNRLIPGFNAINDKQSPQDDVGHGTHVSGIIAASVNNNLGIAGLTWNNPIMPIKVLDSSGAGNAYNVAKGIIWATDHGAKVINMSLGNYAQADFLHDAVKYAYDHDVVIVAASGNDNTVDPGYPAAYPEVIAVAATDSNFQKASFSNFGDYIDVAAPGVSIASTYTKGQYASLSGTSMASPHVAALAALIRSTNPTLKNIEVMRIIRNTAKDLGTAGKDAYYGFGEIDISRALEASQLNANRAGEGLKINGGDSRNLFKKLLHRILGTD
ncbi:MAG: peptidase S8 [Gorillibacterium sp.]|nr:peptidase S8 [Gorillibacterium sp.]